MGREDTETDGKGRDTCTRKKVSLGAERAEAEGNEPAFLPVFSSVSATISSRTLLKSKNFSPGR